MNTLISIACTMLLFAGVQSLRTAPLKKHAKGAEIRILASKEKHGNQNAFLGHLTIPANGKVPLHQDVTEEYLFVLVGGGTLWIAGKKSSIKKDDLVFMPANAKVKFENGPVPTKVLQVFAPQGPEKKYNSWGGKMKPGVKKK